MVLCRPDLLAEFVLMSNIMTMVVFHQLLYLYFQQASVFDRSLQLSSLNGSNDIGKITNHMSTDASIVMVGMQMLYNIISIPIVSISSLFMSFPMFSMFRIVFTC